MNEDIVINEIQIADSFQGFDCNNPSLNNYLINMACFDHVMKFSSTQLVKMDNTVIAYFTMKIYNIIESDDYEKYIYPSVYLKCLAVDKKHQSNGIGTELLSHIISESIYVSQMLGCRFLVLDSTKDNIRWYENRGFEKVEETRQISETTTRMVIDFRNKELLDLFIEE